MCQRFPDPGKAGLVDTATQIVGGQQRVHDVQELDRKAFAGRRQDRLAVWSLLLSHWTVQLHHFICELLAHEQTAFIGLERLLHCSINMADVAFGWQALQLSCGHLPQHAKSG